MRQETQALMAEIGFLAGGHGYHREAETICDALEVALPGDGKPVIIRAFNRMNAGRPEEAAMLLEDALARDIREADMVRAFLGLAHHLAGREADKRRVLGQVVDAGDPDAVRLARALL